MLSGSGRAGRRQLPIWQILSSFKTYILKIFLLILGRLLRDSLNLGENEKQEGVDFNLGLTIFGS